MHLDGQVDAIFMCFDFPLVPFNNARCCTSTTEKVIMTWRLIKHKSTSLYTCTSKTV